MGADFVEHRGCEPEYCGPRAHPALSHRINLMQNSDNYLFRAFLCSSMSFVISQPYFWSCSSFSGNSSTTSSEVVTVVVVNILLVYSTLCVCEISAVLKLAILAT